MYTWNCPLFTTRESEVSSWLTRSWLLNIEIKSNMHIHMWINNNNYYYYLSVSYLLIVIQSYSLVPSEYGWYVMVRVKDCPLPRLVVATNTLPRVKAKNWSSTYLCTWSDSYNADPTLFLNFNIVAILW